MSYVELLAKMMVASPSLREILAASKGGMSGLAMLYVRATTCGATQADIDAFDRAMDEVEKAEIEAAIQLIQEKSVEWDEYESRYNDIKINITDLKQEEK